MERVWADMEPEEYTNFDDLLKNNREKQFRIMEPAPIGSDVKGDVQLLYTVALTWGLLSVEVARMVYLSIGETFETRGIRVTRLA